MLTAEIMSHRTDHAGFLIRFGCAAVFYGFVFALIGIRFVDTIEPLFVVAWAVLTISVSILVASRGDAAWRRLAGWLRWWI